MTKIEPMLLSETFDKEILEDDTKWFQIKENGVRAIVHVIDGKIVGIRNRANNPILYQFPELRDVKFPFNTGILDAEVCVYKNGKSVFYGGIDKRRSAPTENTLKEHPAKLILFDALKIDNNVLVMKGYKDRYSQLSQNMPEDSKVEITKNYTNGKELWSKVTNENQEGVVIKTPNAMYELGKRSSNYIKLKNYKTTEIVVEKVEPNSRGTKIFGKVADIDVECQLAGIFDVEVGSTQTIKYLDIAGDRLIQPTKVSREQLKSTSVIS
jgi:bifunctional non-homologous end joining protein LigD